MQRKLSHLLLALCAIGVLILTSCHGDSGSNPSDPGSNTTTISTTIAGLVSDENGKPVSGAEVKAHGQTVMTNNNGLFILHNITVPPDRCFVIVSHNGYFNAARAEAPHTNGVTNMLLSMMSNTAVKQVSASTGGKVSLPGGGVIDLPANGYVGANGNAYTGTVNVAARHLDPTSPTFFNYFAGDFAAQRSNGSRTDLISYGVLRVELTGSTGEKLLLASGKTATLSYPIPTALQSGAPPEMPLWYFDEQIGMWKEEGKAVKQGNIYTGEVSHFTEWNCDLPDSSAELSGTVSCIKPIPGALVTVGERQAITDGNGYYHLRVPAGITFDISMQAGLNRGISSTPVTIGPFSTGDNVTHDIRVDLCGSYVSGTLVDCNNRPIEGVVQLTGVDFTGYMVVESNGLFTIRVPMGIALSMDAFGYDGTVSTVLPIDPVQVAETKEIGHVQLCSSGNSIPYVDITIDDAMLFTLSPDGSRLAVITTHKKTMIYNTQDGTLLQTMTLTGENGIASMVEFSDDGSKLLTVHNFNPNPVNVWDVGTGKNLHAFSGIENPHFLPGGTAIIAVETSEPHDVLKLEISTGEELDRYPHGKGSLHFISPGVNEAQFVASHSVGSPFKIFIWNMNINALANEFQLDSPDNLFNLDISSDRKLLIVHSETEARLYSVSNGQLVNTIPIPSPLFSNFALAPDNISFAGQTQSGQTALYQNGGVLRLLPTTHPFYNDFVFSRQGTRLAAYSSIEDPKQIIRIWQLP